MRDDASDLARRLSGQAEAVCRHYLSNGRRVGSYWVVGDVGNMPGRSLYVRLAGPSSGKGAAGKWRDAATAEHGDLLDLIARSQGIDGRDMFDEARRFLALPRTGSSRQEAWGLSHRPDRLQAQDLLCARDRASAARRLWAISRPIAGTLAETYLRARAITHSRTCASLRFHPRCWYRGSDYGPAETWPALIAAVHDDAGTLTGVHRTWLSADGLGKASIAVPRKAMGKLLGKAVRFESAPGVPAQGEVIAAGEGIETMLSLRQVLPDLSMAAALSAGHLGAFMPPSGLRRLYIARDKDAAGRRAADRLGSRARGLGIEALVLTPTFGDFNDDLRAFGPQALAASIRLQLAPEDVGRFLAAATAITD